MKEEIYSALEDLGVAKTSRKKVWDYIVKNNSGLKEVTNRYEFIKRNNIKLNSHQLLALVLKDIGQSSYLIKDRERLNITIKSIKSELKKVKIESSDIDKISELLQYTIIDEYVLSDLNGNPHLFQKANNEQRILLEFELIPFTYLEDGYNNYNIERYKQSQIIMTGASYLRYLKQNLTLLNNSLNAPLFRTNELLIYNNKAKSNLNKTVKWVKSGHRMY